MGVDSQLGESKFTPPRKGKFKKKMSRTQSEHLEAIPVVNKQAAHDLIPAKRNRKSAYNPEEESRLERLVFGDPDDVLQNLDKSHNDNEKLQSLCNSEIKNKDTYDTNDLDNDDKDSVIIKSDDESVITIDSKTSINVAAWVDTDDQDLSVNRALSMQKRKLPKGRSERTYSQLLQNKFTKLMGTPKWAQLNRERSEDSDDSDSEILKHSNYLVQKKTTTLSCNEIDIKAVAHLNKQTHVEGPFINSVQFHETSTVALVTGSSGVLSLFEVDGKDNNKLHSMKFERFPIDTARFLKEGTEIVIGSQHAAHCFSYNLNSGKSNRILLPHGITNMKNFEVSPDGKVIAICGRRGEIHLLSSSTKELIGTMKMNRTCKALTFTKDSSKLITHGESSEIYTWDVKSRMCLNRAFDDGCLSGLSLAISPNGQYIATGSKQGAVNLYETNAVTNESVPKPIKTVLNLVTAITSLNFNPTTEILAIASDRKMNAFKMLHLPSFHVFHNFPTPQTQMSFPVSLDFSPGSGFMSIGNNKGFAYLYRLKHYGNY